MEDEEQYGRENAKADHHERYGDEAVSPGAFPLRDQAEVDQDHYVAALAKDDFRDRYGPDAVSPGASSLQCQGAADGVWYNNI